MNYRQDIELFRILSAFGIVWFHSHLKGGDIGYSGLLYFIILSLYLSGDNHSVIQRSKRLLIPWLFWSFSYGFLNIITTKPFLDISNGVLAGLLAGPHIHLWYLPFIFFTLILFDFIKSKLAISTIGISAAFIAFVSLVSVSLWRDYSNSLGAPWAQYFHALPAVFIGACYWASNKLANRLLFFVMVLVLFLTAAININVSGVGIPYTIAILLYFPVLFLPPWLKLNFNIRKVSELTLGIYLLHPFIFMVFYKLNIDLGYYSPLVVFISCNILVYTWKKCFPTLSKYII
ncbi:MAG: hypothetical protein CVV44_05580 [Spirochaetae bacterium HGW-Spirochaetae-1]|jgi:hypothetical protein|nr:MAG: hypothetical protein CVV44_05580 [Spirochaetae bacterium HGW-Spirochaetae-1]